MLPDEENKEPEQPAQKNAIKSREVKDFLKPKPKVSVIGGEPAKKLS